MSENKHIPESTCPSALPFMITDQEMKDLMRFHECVTDGEGYDVPKERMKQLAEIGLLRRVTSNFYEHTTFGLSVINGDFQSADEIRKQRDELLADRDTWKSRAEFSYQQRDVLEGRASLAEAQRDELLLTETNLRQQIAHLNDEISGHKSTIKFVAKGRDELLAALQGLHKICEIALSGKDGQQHTYFETRAGHFVEATAAMQTAEAAIAGAPDNLHSFSLRFDREEWGHVIDGLILERERSMQRKQANPESNSNNIADRCAELIDKIAKAAEIKSAKGGAA